VKWTGGDEPNGDIRQIFMETTQGNSLCSYLYLKLAKCQVPLFIFYVSSSITSENRTVEQVLQGDGCGRGKDEVAG
jgi:hypothetical protein